MHRHVILHALGRFAAAAAIFFAAPADSGAQVRAAIVRDTDQPARQPVTISGNINQFVPTGTVDLDICPSPSTCAKTVPAGKRLVIESVSARCRTFVGFALLFFSVETTLHIQPLLLNMHLPRTIVSGDVYYSASQAVRLYSDPLTKVRLIVEKSGGAGFFGVFSAYGYLVDLN